MRAEARLIDQLAARACAARFNTDLAPAVEAHVFDTLGALFAGVQTREGQAISRAFAAHFAGGQSPASLVARMTACTRLTEADDIQIEACVTPGSVVVSAALAASLATSTLATANFGAAIVAGYDAMASLGLAIDGARVVYGPTWPTLFGAAMSAAATAGRVLDLDEPALRHAIAIAATSTSGAQGRIAGDPSSRFLSLGCAAQAGLAAAFAAREGVLGDLDILETYREAFGIVHQIREQAIGVGILEASLKPYCTGRQSLSATQAFADLLRENDIEPASITRVVARAPAQYRAMIDRSARPRSKLESRGLRYQIALAAFHADELFDIERENLRTDERGMTDLMDRIEIVEEPRLSELYPRAWGAIVSIECGAQTFEKEIHAPKGAPQDPMTLADIEDKYRRMSALLHTPIAIEKLRVAARALDAGALLALFEAANRGRG